MSDLTRFGVSLENSLLAKFDQLIKKKKYQNRSEAIRDLIREELVKKEWQLGHEVAGAITFVYDHHQRELLEKIVHIQHDYHSVIISSQHVHLDHRNCLEIIALKGKTSQVKELFNNLKAVKGIKHAAISMSSSGKEL